MNGDGFDDAINAEGLLLGPLNEYESSVVDRLVVSMGITKPRARGH